MSVLLMAKAAKLLLQRSPRASTTINKLQDDCIRLPPFAETCTDPSTPSWMPVLVPNRPCVRSAHEVQPHIRRTCTQSRSRPVDVRLTQQRTHVADLSHFRNNLRHAIAWEMWQQLEDWFKVEKVESEWNMLGRCFYIDAFCHSFKPWLCVWTWVSENRTSRHSLCRHY